MKNRIVQILICGILIVSLFANGVQPVFAQTQTDDSKVTFAKLGENEILLNGPIDAANVQVVLPAFWSPKPGATLHLDMHVYIAGQNSTANTPSTGAVGYIQVNLNDTWVDTIQLDKYGEVSVDLKIPEGAWVLTPPNTTQLLKLNLRDAVRCSLLTTSGSNRGEWGTTAAIHTSSYLSIPHDVVSTTTDLSSLPYPIYQGSFIPDNAVLLIPDQPTQGELQAAITVQAVMGRLSSGKLNMKMLTVSQLASDTLAKTNVIFVGNPANFAMLKDAKLPAEVSGSGFSNPNIAPEDGVLQMIVSPLDNTKVWLVVSGSKDAGMIKAAQALGSEQIRPFGPTNFAIVTNVQAKPSASEQTDVTLANLGYSEQTYSGFGINYFVYYFDVSSNQSITDGAYFDMYFNSSPLLNFQESGITVTLNDKFVGGVRFSDQTTNITNWKINIPAYMFHAGRNLLLLEVNLSAMSPCITLDSIWASVKENSMLHLPSLPSQGSVATEYSLTSYPSNLFPTFDNTGFVLAHDDPTGWSVAGQIAFDLGKSIGGTVVNPTVVYGDAVPDTFLKEKGLVVVGQPSKLPVMSQLAQSMPAPFPSGKDVANEPSPEFSFNVSADKPVGYLQVFGSPSNAKYAILTLSGNSGDGIKAAGYSLLTPTIRGNINGNLAVIYNNKVITASVPALAQAQPTAMTVVQANSTTASNNQNGPFQITLASVGVAIVVIFVIVGLVVLLLGDRRKKKA